jgi:hypothetical protein
VLPLVLPVVVDVVGFVGAGSPVAPARACRIHCCVATHVRRIHRTRTLSLALTLTLTLTRATRATRARARAHSDIRHAHPRLRRDRGPRGFQILRPRTGQPLVLLLLQPPGLAPAVVVLEALLELAGLLLLGPLQLLLLLLVSLAQAALPAARPCFPSWPHSHPHPHTRQRRRRRR